MSYDEFLESVRARITARVEKGDEVRLSKIIKNNNNELDALLIRRQGQNMAPTIYLKRYYDEYCKGTKMEDIIETILYIEGNCKPQPFFDFEHFYDLNKIKPFIYARLVNTSRNKKQLSDWAHKEILDLSVIYYVAFESREDGVASTIVRKDFLERWGISNNELHEIALENTFAKRPAKVRPISELLLNMLTDDASEDVIDMIHRLEECERDRMFVITNEQGLYGSIYMLFPELLESFAREYGNFYILPSSIHELIFLNADTETSKEYLYEMVHQVNTQEVPAEDYLSDSVYYYRSEEKCVEIV